MDVLFAADVLELKCPMEKVPASGVGGPRQGLEVDRSIPMTVAMNVVIEGIMPGTAADIEGEVVEIGLTAAHEAVLATEGRGRGVTRDPAVARGRADLDRHPRRAGAAPVPRTIDVQGQGLVLVADLLQKRTEENRD